MLLPYTTATYSLSLHDALPILWIGSIDRGLFRSTAPIAELLQRLPPGEVMARVLAPVWTTRHGAQSDSIDRKSTRLNSSHLVISYAVFCLKKKKIMETTNNTTK